MSTEKCPVCKYKLPPNAKFCPDCGNPLNGTSKEKKERSGGNRFRDMIIIVGVLAVVAAAYFIVKSPQSTAKQPEVSQQGHAPVPGMEGMVGNMPSLPTDYNSLVAFGHETMDQQNYVMAAECYRRALAIDGSNDDVRTDYGACLHFMGLPHRAVEEFNNVLSRQPNHIVANYNMGIVYFNENQADSARKYWTKFLTLGPDSSMAATVTHLLDQMDG